MSAVVDSKMQMLDEDEIIGISAQETNSPYSPEQIKAAILAETTEAGALIIREGNTFFIINPTNKPDIVMFRALNADTVQNYIDNSIKTARALSEKGINLLVIDFTDDSVLRILKSLANGAGNSGMGNPGSGYTVKQTSNGGYRAVVKIESLKDTPDSGLSSVEGIQQ
jgi:uridylate kinase